MATVTNVSLGPTSGTEQYYTIKSTISGLQYNAEWYDSFRFWKAMYLPVDDVGWFVIDYDEVIGSSFTGHDYVENIREGYFGPYNYWIMVECIKGNDSWDVWGNQFELPGRPTVPTDIDVSATGKTINISFTKGNVNGIPVNEDYENVDAYYTWLDTSWESGNDNHMTSGTSFSVTAPACNTEYSIRLSSEGAYHLDNYLRSAWSSYSYITTDIAPKLATPSTSNSKDTKSISFSINTVSNASGYRVTCNGSNQDFGSGGGNGTFSNLTHNTLYAISIIALGDSGVNYRDSDSSSVNVTTDTLTTPSTPTNISFAQNGNTKHVDTSFTKGANSTHTDIDMSSDGSDWGSVDWPSQANSSYSLDTGYYGQHYFRVRARNYDGYNSLYSGWSSSYAVNFFERPSNFAWTTTITQGGGIYSTDLANKTLYIITAAEWTALQSKINAFRVYKGLGNYSFTSVSRGTEITKTLINQAISAITDITGRSVNPPTARSTGDIINLASLYIGLRDSLNSTS